VDGLLGIGAAGGSTASNEAAMLQARLKELRSERERRAAEQKDVVIAAAVPSTMAKQPNANLGNMPPNYNRPGNKKKRKSRK